MSVFEKILKVTGRESINSLLSTELNDLLYELVLKVESLEKEVKNQKEINTNFKNDLNSY